MIFNDPSNPNHSVIVIPKRSTWRCISRKSIVLTIYFLLDLNSLHLQRLFHELFSRRGNKVHKKIKISLLLTERHGENAFVLVAYFSRGG